MKQLRRNSGGDRPRNEAQFDLEPRRTGKADPSGIGTIRGWTRTGLMEGARHVPKKAARQANASAASDVKSLDLQIDAIQIREAELSVREVLLREREAQLSQRELEIHNLLGYRSAQDNFNARLRQANEQLVLTSVQLQITAEQLEKSKAEMADLAMHDLLTKLPNRMQLNDRIGQAIVMARRHDTKLAILFIDLDRFKEVNDTFGHSIGDRLLQLVAQRLKGAIRDSDTVSRLGGDEFVLLLSEVGDAEALKQKIENIHHAIIAPYDIDGEEFEIEATIGVSIFPGHGEDPESLIHNADTAMYCAKKAGLEPYHFFDSIED